MAYTYVSILTVVVAASTASLAEAFVSKPFISRPGFTSSLDATPATGSDVFTLTVALTREDGKNDKLMESLSNHPTREMLKSTMDLNLVEMPTITHAVGSDFEAFQKMAEDDPSFDNYDYIVITSPESAKVFGESVKPSDDLPKIAAVGKATQKALTNQGFEVNFVPSKANGETLAEELPPVNEMRLNNVLYPASEKAAETIQENLGKRKDASFRVYRLNTYDTVSATLSEDQIDTLMDDVHIACFGSPTAVDGWLANVDRALGIEDLDDEEKKKVEGSNGNVVAVCIGSTTAKRCLETGRWQSNDIYYPSRDPGLHGWTESCFTAGGDVLEREFWGGGW